MTWQSLSDQHSSTALSGVLRGQSYVFAIKPDLTATVIRTLLSAMRASLRHVNPLRIANA
jgi:hypothetical protein